MSDVQRSILFSALERYGSVAILFATMAVLSRLLTPAEFGVYAVISAILTLISASYQEMGGANYLIQKARLSTDDIRSAFTVTLLLSVAIAMALALIGDWIAGFYGQEGLGHGLAIAATSLLLAPFSLTITALYRREMQFGTLALCNLAANVMGNAAAIWLAVLHYSFMAPVWGVVISNLVATVLLLAVRRDISVFRPSFSAAKDVIGFGLYSSGVSIVNIVYNLSPQIFLARILDFSAAGLYSRAIGVTQLFDRLVGQVLSPVIMPAVFRQLEAGGDLKRIYLDAIRLLSAVYWPALAITAIMAEPIITIWLGSTWTEVIPLVQVICIAYLALFAACLTYPIMVAAGRIQDVLRCSLISLPPSLCLVFAASFFGVTWVAASMLITLPFQAAVAIGFIAKRLHLGWIDLIGALWKSALISLITSVSALIFAALIQLSVIDRIPGLIAGMGCAVATWLAGIMLTQHPLSKNIITASSALLPERLTRLWATGDARNIQSAEQGQEL